MYLPLSAITIAHWLKEQDPTKLTTLWEAADQLRRQTVGEAIYLRGLLEISNYCRRACTYCGINRQQQIQRYRMTLPEILAAARLIMQSQCATIVLQAGEDPELNADFISEVIYQLKQQALQIGYDLAITLSLGERKKAELVAWKQAGADRYLLRFETSNLELYRLIHPPLTTKESVAQRFLLLQELQQLGYEVGSGIMIGLPGQSYQSLAEDILKFHQLNLDMIGVGPYLSVPATALATNSLAIPSVGVEQVPATALMTYKVIALSRLVCPMANIPSTTALATIDPLEGRVAGLKVGANIMMPNFTPFIYRQQYVIYPDKAGTKMQPEDAFEYIQQQITKAGRIMGHGIGGRRRI